MKWISIKDELPLDDSHVMVSDGVYVISALKIRDGWLIPPFFDGVSHWMPMPGPPKEGE